MLIGEIYLPVERLVAYYGAHRRRPRHHLPFNFQLLELPWDARTSSARRSSPTRPRCRRTAGRTGCSATTTSPASRHASVDAQARVAAMLLLTLRGTPTIYYGDEIGMTDVDIPAAQEQDPARFDSVTGGRDPERTPMRWDATANAGFTTGEPWLPIGDDVATVNVATERRRRARCSSCIAGSSRCAARSRRSRSATGCRVG